MSSPSPSSKPLTSEHVELLHLDYAASMVDRLVPYTEDVQLPTIVQNACLEAFFVNVRLLAEFLQGKGCERKDFWATKLLPSWQRAEGEQAARLDQWWDIASKHVVHFGLPRLASHAEDALDVNLALLGCMREDVLTLYGRFRREYQDLLPEDHPDKRLGLAPPEADAPDSAAS